MKEPLNRTGVEGGIDLETGKLIHSLILCSQNNKVFLDDALNVEWSFDGEIPDGYGDVVNRMAYLDARSEFLREKRYQLEPIRRLMGEAIARILDDRDVTLAKNALNNAEALIDMRNKEISKGWYYQVLILGTLVGLLIFTSIWFYAASLPSSLPGLDIMLAICLSPMGVFASVVARNRHIDLDASAGRMLHRLESISRILTGVIAALLILLLVDANLLFSQLNQDGSRFPLFLAIGILGGASERALPSLIDRFDNSLQNDPTFSVKDAATEPTQVPEEKKET